MKLRILLAACLLAPAAAAQDVEDGCTQSNPCPWSFDLSAEGIDDGTTVAEWNFTVGDWIALDVFNFDEEDHLLSVAGMEWTVPAIDAYESAPFQFDQAGSYTLQDQPSGDTATVTILAPSEEEQAVAEEEEAESPDRGIPSPLGLLAIPAAALLARRR